MSAQAAPDTRLALCACAFAAFIKRHRGEMPAEAFAVARIVQADLDHLATGHAVQIDRAKVIAGFDQFVALVQQPRGG